MTGPRPAVQSANSLPETWAWFPPEGGERAVAARLGDGEETRAELAEWLRLVRPEMRLDEFAGTAIWVPQRDSSEYGGLMQVEVIVPDEGQRIRWSRDDFRRDAEPEQRPWLTVYSQNIEDLELPAGPALLVREVTSRNERSDTDEDPIMTSSTIYSVFPPDSTDILNFIFKTNALALSDDLAADAAWIMNTLEVTLGEPA